MRPSFRPVFLLVATFLLPNFPAQGFDFGELERRAEDIARHDYQHPATDLPPELEQLDYSGYRKINYSADHAVWRSEGLPFQLEMFHRGYLFHDKVTISEIIGGEERLLPFSPENFDYRGALTLPPQPADFGFSGFRIHYPINRAYYLDEMAVFQGASYFRMLGRGLLYGLSARGVAVNTFLPDEVEEFPSFEQFWVRRPESGSDQITVMALLNGPSVAGAYEFVIRPGETTVADVRATLFFRRQVRRLGLAPLTSMFWYGENSFHRFGDFRPEVHDSDGLLHVTKDGLTVWRPLQTLRAAMTNTFSDPSPKGFGLLQRDTDFRSYEDMAGKYHLRPSAWAEPTSDWGDGSLLLVQLATNNEFADNIVTQWTPAVTPAPGQPFRYSYRLSWFKGDRGDGAQSRVLSTHIQKIGESGSEWRFVLDFSHPPGLDLPAAQDGPQPPAYPRIVLRAAPNVTLHDQYVEPVPEKHGWRVGFVATLPHPDAVTDLTCTLVGPENAWRSEDWQYTVAP